MYKKIVVGTDLSETSKIAVSHARLLADKLDAELILLFAGGSPGRALDDLASEVGAKAVTAEGPPAEVLLSEAKRLEADLLVVGSVGMSGARRFTLGNVPNKVSHHADRDVLIVKTDKGEREGGYRKILVGADGSPTAMRAVEAATGLAKQLDAAELIVTAFEPPTQHEMEQLKSGMGDAISTWNATREQRQTPDQYRWRIAGAAQAQDVVERAAEHAAESGGRPEVKAVEGSPAEVLLSVAEEEDCDLICVGSVGMSGAKRFMLGNVPNRISHHSPTDVLILHTS